jgi:hypothetical protein
MSDLEPVATPLDGHMVKGFMTGSQIYGNPRPDSDIDIVLLVDENLLHMLAEKAGKHLTTDQYEDKPESASLTFGQLNLICVTASEEYDAWLEGTEECFQLMQSRWLEKGPADHYVTRDEAKDLMKKAYEKHNLAKADPQ